MTCWRWRTHCDSTVSSLRRARADGPRGGHRRRASMVSAWDASFCGSRGRKLGRGPADDDEARHGVSWLPKTGAL